MAKRKNILFLFADDMKYSTVSALGNPEIKTPNLDELARNGTSFVNAHIPGCLLYTSSGYTERDMEELWLTATVLREPWKKQE